MVENRKVDEQIISHMREVFTMEDTKNEGVLSTDKISKLLGLLGVNMTEKEQFELVSKLDPENSHEFTYEKLEEYILPKISNFTKGTFISSLDIFDFNKDHKMPFDDFEMVMTTFGIPFSKEELDDVQARLKIITKTDQFEIKELANKTINY